MARFKDPGAPQGSAAQGGTAPRRAAHFKPKGGESPVPQRPQGTRFASPQGASAQLPPRPAGKRFARQAPAAASAPSQPLQPPRPVQPTAQRPAQTVPPVQLQRPARPATRVIPPDSPYSRSSSGGSGVPPRKGAQGRGSSHGGGRPPRRRSNALSIVLIVVGIALLLVAGGMFAWTQLGYRQAVESYDSLTQYVMQDEESGLPQVDFDELAKINPDIVAWIYIPGTTVSYPVVQTDDNQTYLDTLFDGTKNASGAIFMDMDDTAPGAVDQQTTLYGHHMMNDTMFNFVDRAHADQAEFDKITEVYYITRDGTYVFKPLFTTRVAPDDLEVRTPNFDGGMEAYLTRLFENATSTADGAGGALGDAEKVLTLVTCNYDLGDKQRSIMVCSLDATI